MRAQFLNTGYRWSSSIPESAGSASPVAAERAETGGWVIRPQVGARLFTDEGNGGFADLEYRIDLNLDVGFDEADRGAVGFFVAHAGYAHRFVFPARRRPDRWAQTLTLTAGVATGFARCANPNTGLPLRSPVIGPYLGVDYDRHFGRYFLGWSLSGDLLVHTPGPHAPVGIPKLGLRPSHPCGVHLRPAPSARALLVGARRTSRTSRGVAPPGVAIGARAGRSLSDAGRARGRAWRDPSPN